MTALMLPSIFPKATIAAPAPQPGYLSLQSDHPSYEDFVAAPSNETVILADISHLDFDTGVGFKAWKNRADAIRKSGDPAYCVGNLSVALSQVGEAYKASSNASTGLLTLLPTAGALIGAPAKELWVLAELIPMAGWLSIALSLGGQIAPHQVGDATNLEEFSTGGQKRQSSPPIEDRAQAAAIFADRVQDRAFAEVAPSQRARVAKGCFGLCCFIVLILVACYLLQAGSVVVWWCRARYWSFLWYGLTVFASILEFFANAPFPKSWTLRVSRSPDIQVLDDSPRVVSSDYFDPLTSPGLSPGSIPGSRPSLASFFAWNSGNTTIEANLLNPDSVAKPDVVDLLEQGLTSFSTVTRNASSPSVTSSTPFCVIISCTEIDRWHRIARLVSKGVSVTVFMFSTALFASSTLLQIRIAMIVMILILVAGIFGRVTAMWISSVLLQDKPVLHQTVHTKEDAAMFVEAILKKPGIVCEIMRHVIIDGRCVKRVPGFRRWTLDWSSIFGVLAPPFDVTKIVVGSNV